jgi:hypothetical protein
VGKYLLKSFEFEAGELASGAPSIETSVMHYRVRPIDAIGSLATVERPTIVSFVVLVPA